MEKKMALYFVMSSFLFIFASSKLIITITNKTYSYGCKYGYCKWCYNVIERL